MQSDVLAYFITWTCYGTHLPGDSRGWTQWQNGERTPQPLLARWCCDQMLEAPIVLNPSQRATVEQAVRDHSEVRSWMLHAVNCRSNHCHVVVTAADYGGEQVRDQFKAWATRRLKRMSDSPGGERRNHWWTRKGSVRQLFDQNSIEAAVQYVLESQDLGGSKATF
jgi:REP element-mobilizing transposase RayT